MLFRSEKDGVTRYSTEIIGDNMQMLGSKDGGGSGANYDGGMDQGGGQDDYNQSAPRQSSSGQSSQQAKPQQASPSQTPAKSGGNFDDFEDDIPF